jgi:hypothetical protein
VLVPVAACVAAGLLLVPAIAQEQQSAASRESPGAQQIVQALEKLRADTSLASERKMRTLNWADSPEEKPRSGELPAWLEWIADLFRWTGESARVLVWVACAVLAGMLVTFLLRLIGQFGTTPRTERFVAPTHVRDLDIRPESLPADIGSAARSLWDQGHQRPALALLYRGLLSRLAHVHGVPVRDSSTEGDCLRLAESHMSAERAGFVARLIRVWQRAVYGGEQIETGVVHALCDGFAPMLDAPAESSLRNAPAEQSA